MEHLLGARWSITCLSCFAPEQPHCLYGSE